MEYFINDFLKPVYKDGELKNPYDKELRAIERKNKPGLKDYVRFLFLNGAYGFWTVNQDQEPKEEYLPLYELYLKVNEEAKIGEIVEPWPELLEWCRCYTLQRTAYETAALNYIATLKAYIREENVLRAWAGDLLFIKDTLKAKGVNVDEMADLWEPPKGLGVGFELEGPIGNEPKIRAINHATKSIIAMIKFLRLGDVFLGMLGKALKFDPSAFTTNPKRWNRIVLELGGIFQNVEMYLLQKKTEDGTPPGELARLESTKALWRGIIEEIRDALKHEWTAKELRPLKIKLLTREDCFRFYEVPTDVEFILKIFGAEKDY